ncbi:MAG: SPFH domain-containing protein [Phototrophicaceae bacterium]
MQGYIIVGIVFFFFVLISSVKVVLEYERLVILFLGRYAGTRGPGLVIVLPFFERSFRVDQRERFLDIPSQTAITSDNAPIAIDFLVYYRITDPMLSVLKVDHVVSAAINIATTTLRAVVGDMDLDSVLSKREQINDTLRVKLDETTERWGLKITTVEIREIEPPHAIQDAMNRQMSAERERRAVVTNANGEKEAAITRAEGQKQAAILAAEGERQAQFIRAQGYAAALKSISEEASLIDERTMMLQYFETLQKIGTSPSTKYVVPMELTKMMQDFVQNMNRPNT